MITKIIKVETDFCNQCKLQEKELLKLKSYFNDNSIQLSVINANDDEEFVTNNDIVRVPTLLFYNEDNKEVLREAGYIKADDIKKRIEELK